MTEGIKKTMTWQNARRETIKLPEDNGRSYAPIEVLKFGAPGARPKAYLQTALHADELPGMLVLRKLAEALDDAAARDEIVGEVVIVPMANPIGISQFIGGYMVGRVEQATDRNFNRDFPDLCALAAERVDGDLTDDPAANVETIREAMRAGLDEVETDDAFSTMQTALIRMACDADIVLDLHADNEALMHLYVSSENWPNAQDLAAELDARAVLLTDESGGDPFDEACGHAWVRLREKFPSAAIPMGCLSATVELRSNDHVDERDAEDDARGLFRFLQRRGLIGGSAGGLPRLLADPGPLRAMQQVRAPIDGLIVYKRRLGDTVRVGDLIAEIVPPSDGDVAEVRAETDGILFARHDQRWAYERKVIGKVAGREELDSRTGHLLTD